MGEGKKTINCNDLQKLHKMHMFNKMTELKMIHNIHMWSD